MTPIREDGLRYGAIAAGALALGAAATAGADKLISSSDIADGSLKARDLSPKAQSGGPTLLNSSFLADWGSTDWVAPGTDTVGFLEQGAQLRVAPGSYKARGLAVRAGDSKGGIDAGDVTVRLRVNGDNTGLKCTTDDNGVCSDSDSANIDGADRVALKVDNLTSKKFDTTTRVSLSLEPN